MNKTLTAVLMLAGLGTIAGIHEGCGIVTAPVSVPMAVAENANFDFSFQPVDQDGRPLSQVLVSQQLDHHFWTPIMGGTETDERSTRRADGRIEVHERGRDLRLTFTRDGYNDVTITITADHPKLFVTDHATWPAIPNFPVVMTPKTIPNGNMRHSSALMNYTDYPKQLGLLLPQVWSAANRSWDTIDISADDLSRMPAGTLYATLTKIPPPALNAKGEVDLVDVNLPADFSLHISGTGNGFIRIAPRIGFPPMQISDMAPAEGYMPEFPISRARLKSMRTAEPSYVLDAAEYFYIKAEGHYGKGMMSWETPMDKKATAPQLATFRFSIWMQAKAGETNFAGQDRAFR